VRGLALQGYASRARVRRRGAFSLAWLLLGLALGAGASPPWLEAAAPEHDAREIAQRAQEVLRAATTYTEAKMTITSPRLPAPREVAFRAWDDRGKNQAFIRVVEPAKDKGMGFLKSESNLWNYIPRVERTVRIPPSMMQQSWMGSDFTNDDLVRESDDVTDYHHRILGIDPKADGGGSRAFVIEYRAREEAPVVWGKIVAWIDVSSFTPLRQDFYDEDGVMVRTLRFGDIRPVAAREFPHRWSATRVEKQGQETVIQIEKVEFDHPIRESVFSTRNLRPRN